MAEKILVAITNDPKWAESAVHLASAMAKNTRSSLLLVQMVCVPHVSWVNTDVGYTTFTERQAEQLSTYTAIAGQYQVEAEVHVSQYFEFADAVVQLAQQTKCHTVFAQLPESRFAWLTQLQSWNIERRLQHLGCALYTLRNPLKTGKVQFEPGF